MSRPGFRSAGPALSIEPDKVRLVVKVRPLDPSDPAQVDCQANKPSTDSLSLEVRMHRRIEQEGMLVSVPHDTSQPDEEAVSIHVSGEIGF